MLFFIWYKNLDRSFFRFCHNARVWQTDGQTDGRTEFSSLDRVCIAWSTVKIGLSFLIGLCLIQDGTECDPASVIMPFIRTTTADNHARLSTRLSSIPVGVGHWRHCITASIGGRHSPDECGLTTRVYPMPSRQEPHSIGRLRIASTQCCLWNRIKEFMYMSLF